MVLRIENPAHLLYETLKFVNFFFIFCFGGYTAGPLSVAGDKCSHQNTQG